MMSVSEKLGMNLLVFVDRSFPGTSHFSCRLLYDFLFVFNKKYINENYCFTSIFAQTLILQ